VTILHAVNVYSNLTDTVAQWAAEIYFLYEQMVFFFFFSLVEYNGKKPFGKSPKRDNA
jgi:hypothetical protein